MRASLLLLGCAVLAPRASAQCASWAPLFGGASPLNTSVDSLAVLDSGSGPVLYACGQFYGTGGAPNGVLQWTPAGWTGIGPPFNNGYPVSVKTLCVLDYGSGPVLIAAGAGGHQSCTYALLSAWNGTTWDVLGGSGCMFGGTGGVNAVAAFDDGTGVHLFAGGLFTHFGSGANPVNIARWDGGSSWSEVGGSVDGPISALAVYDDGTGPALYAGGVFGVAGGVPAPCIARWNGTSWSGLGSGIDGPVSVLTVFDDGSGPALYVGGNFTVAGGVPATNIARWNGAGWSAVGGGTDGGVVAMAIHDDGSGPALYAGGGFTQAGGVSAARVARWDGASWSALGSGLVGNVFALASFDDGSDGDADLIAGGDLAISPGGPTNFVAQWYGCGVTPFCFGDGSTVACPCANNGLAGHGCENSVASGGALLSATGTASPDSLVLHATGETASALSIFLQGSASLATPLPFGDGLRCTGGALKRLYAKPASSGAVDAPLAGDPSITARSAALGDVIAPGSARHYQVYYRDGNPGFCPPPAGSNFNVGNALRVVW